MGRIVVISVLLVICLVVAGGMFLPWWNFKRLEMARRRLLDVFNQLRDFSGVYDTREKERFYLAEDAAWRKSPCGDRLKAEYYRRYTDELKAILDNPDQHLEHLIYDPVDNGFLEDPVEVVVDHPIWGIVYITVNRRNIGQMRLIFCRDKKHYSASYNYQIRMNRSMPGDVKSVHLKDGRVLVDRFLLHHLLTDQMVNILGIYSGKVLPETVQTFPFIPIKEAINAQAAEG